MKAQADNIFAPDILLFKKVPLNFNNYHFRILDDIFKNKKNNTITEGHWHEEFEISYVKKGSFVFGCGGDTYTVNKGSIFMKNSGDLHSLVCNSMDAHIITIILESPFIGFDLRLLIFQNIIEKDTKLEEYIIKIAEENNLKKPGFKLRINSLLLKCLSVLSSEYVISTMTKSEYEVKFQKDNRINMVIEYINQNYQKQLSINELASLIEVSDAHLMRVFKKRFGKTIVNYINEVRLDKACIILRDFNDVMPIGKLCKECGIPNYRYFCTLHKKRYGFTPMKLRQHLRKNSS